MANGEFCRLSTIECRRLFVGDAKAFARMKDTTSNLEK
jgi:hypothetical protein